MNSNRIRVIDLFSGCGGLSLGFQNAGFEIVAAYDNWNPAIEVYSENFKHPIIKTDLSNLDNLDKFMSFDHEVIIGGPPCQDFSSAGHRNEKLGRADLTVVFADIVSKLLPKYFLMENVPRVKNSYVFKTATERLKEAGYGLTGIVLDASRCGVPQIRKRFFLIGKLNGNHDFLLNDITEGLSEKQLTLFDYFGKSLGFEHYFRVPRSYNRRGIFSIYEPSMTIRGVDRPVPPGYPGHPGDSIPLNPDIRSLTVKERSLIQTFPSNFKFNGSKTNMNQLIGNAVPVNLAKYVAEKLLKHINNEK